MDSYLSCGVDIGTTTFHFVVTRVFLRPSLTPGGRDIGGYDIIHQSPVLNTPYHLQNREIDEERILRDFDRMLNESRISVDLIESGAAIVTGMAALKQNASRIVKLLSSRIPNLTSTIAGPRLESLLAARGAGAPEASRHRAGRVIHVDIGGGTSNVAVFQQGEWVDLASLWIGGRTLTRIDDSWIPAHAALEAFIRERGWKTLDDACAAAVADHAAEILWNYIQRGEAPLDWIDEPFERIRGVDRVETIGFSGGVGEWISTLRNDPAADLPNDDIGAALARSLIAKAPEGVEWLSPVRPIRATVMGVGVFAARISGDTIFLGGGVNFPLIDLPIAHVSLVDDHSDWLETALQRGRSLYPDVNVFCFCIHHEKPLSFTQVERLAAQAAGLIQRDPGKPLILILNQNAARILGYHIKRLTPGVEADRVIVIDGVDARDHAYIDVGSPMRDGAVPVVVKNVLM